MDGCSCCCGLLGVAWLLDEVLRLKQRGAGVCLNQQGSSGGGTDSGGRAKSPATVYDNSGFFSPKKIGSIDASGEVRDNGFFFSHKVGSVDKSTGDVYDNSGFFFQNKVGSVDKDGNVYDNSGFFFRRKVGRVDKSTGDVYDNRGFFFSRKIGRVDGAKDDASSAGAAALLLMK